MLLFNIQSSSSPFVQRISIICAILVEGIVRNIYLWNYFECGPVVQEEMSFKDISYLELWQLCLAQQNQVQLC